MKIRTNSGIKVRTTIRIRSSESRNGAGVGQEVGTKVGPG